MHHLKSGSTSNPLHATPSGMEDEEQCITITVNVKATTEITIKTDEVEVYVNDKRSVEQLVKEALEKAKELIYYEHVQVTSGNVVIDLNTKLSDFKDGTVLDISK